MGDSLERIAAKSLQGHCAQGQTLPLYIACDPPEGETVFQAKIAGRRSNLTPRELGLELLGSCLSLALGLYCPTPVVIELTPAIRDRIDSDYDFGCSDDTAFGAVWIRDTVPFSPEFDPRAVSPEENSLLLAVDLLLGNGDRTPANPNVCWRGSRLMVFDFEHSFELPRIDYPRRLELHLESLEPLWASHLTCEGTSRSTVLEAVANAADEKTVVSIEAFAADLPETWKTDWRDHLGYLRYIGANRDRMLERIEDLWP